MEHDTFHHNDERYRCCCMHVKTASWIVGILLFIGFFTNFVSHVQKLSTAERDFSIVVFDVVQLVCLILLFVGLYQKRSKLLMPPIIIMIVEEVLFALAIVIFGIVYVFWEAEEGDHKGENIMKLFQFFMAIIVIAMIFYAIALYVVYRCHKYLKDVEAHKRSVEGVALN